MSNVSKELRNTLRALHGMIDSDSAPESELAMKKLKEALAANGLKWSDLDWIIRTDDEPAAPADNGGGDPFSDVDPCADEPTPQEATPVPLAFIDNLLRRYLYLTDAEIIALALWIAHTFVYRDFSISPRLVLLSPTNGCGKSTVLAIVEQLSFAGLKIDNITAAALYRLIDKEHPCVLIDEGDNADLPLNSSMRSAINSGHRSDGKAARCGKGGVNRFGTFGPLAVAAIGVLPVPLLCRAIVLEMKRAPSAAALERFDLKGDEGLVRMIQMVFGLTAKWSLGATLNPDPPMPVELQNRQADNWRVLLAIADDCGGEWPQKARDAAIELSLGRADYEDAGVVLMRDLRSIWPPFADRMMSADIVSRLCDLDGAFWSEWRGPCDDQAPHMLTAGQLALLLGRFKIKSKTLWPKGPRGPKVKCAKGYLREQFVEPWASYCDDEPAEPERLHAA
jgi:hypothetical protein